MNRLRLVVPALVFLSSAWMSAAVTAVEFRFADSFKARLIGPAGMSGRVTVIEALRDNPHIVYTGTATGGVWKSLNGGLTWQPVFDREKTASIGALAVSPVNPNIVWVGTGEANLRNSVGVGRGVYRSIDGGKTWKFLGLEKTEHISRIIAHPTQPDTAYVAALGTTWGENNERGVFRTTDGGKSWQNILFVDARSGAADLVMAPDNPNRLIAAMWQHRRWPWFFQSGGPGSGLHVSTDGGDTWRKLTVENGLPAGDLGRCGLAFAPGAPQVAYALVEAKRSVLLRSEDGGESWKTVNSQLNFNGRPFYYADLRVHPQNENVVYSLQSQMMVSEDGGRTFRGLIAMLQAHPDYHAMWIHGDGRTMYVGNDGGVSISRDRGKTWHFCEALPLAQYYHVSIDSATPYNVYGGLQDNGSWRGPSMVLDEGVIRNSHWKMLGGGDGFGTEADPLHPGCGYAMSQVGELIYFDTNTSTFRTIRPTESAVPHRFNWNAPLALDPLQPGVIYYGSQFVHRSADRGRNWEIISPDLTSNDPAKQKQKESGGLSLDVTGAENHTTLLAIAPSPLERGVIWTGSDDGCLHLTRDGGKTWTPLHKALQALGLPAGTAIPHIRASRHNAAVCYVVAEDHQRSNWTPYVFCTDDYGKTWRSLAGPDIDGFCHAIEEDSVNPNLLFLGTEFGLYYSIDRGKQWLKWSNGLPTVAVYDLAIQPREHDLVVATHGRGVFILDDIAPLSALSAATAQKPLHLFPSSPARQYRGSWMPTIICPGDGSFQGENRPLGAFITYSINPAPTTGAAGDSDKNVEITILDKQGKTVRVLKGPAKAGIQRMVWDLRAAAFPNPGAGADDEFFGENAGGPRVLPGSYTVRLRHAGAECQGEVEVLPDPRLPVDEAGRLRCHELTMELGAMLQDVDLIMKRIETARRSLKLIQEMSGDEKPKPRTELREAAAALERKLQERVSELIGDKSIQGTLDFNDVVVSRINSALFAVEDSLEPPTQAALVLVEKARAAYTSFKKSFTDMYLRESTELRRKLDEAGFTLLPRI